MVTQTRAAPAISRTGSGLPSRVVIHGVEGCGKSSLGAFAPKPVFSMTRGESGLLTLIDNALVGPTDHFDEAMAWGDLLEQVRWLTAGDHQNRTYVLDTLNGAERLCFEHVTREKFDGNPEQFLAYGKGPEIAQAEWIKLLLLLDELRNRRRMSIMLLCHTRIKTFRNPDGDDFDRYCFAGETLVATRDGLKPISSLAGKEVELLVPNNAGSGDLCEVGSFVKAPVTSRGVQRIWEIRLRRARSEMTVRATANHRWVLKRNYRHEPHEDWKTTAELQPGDTLRTLRNWPISQNGEPMPVAVMQGFTFGDGGKCVSGDASSELAIYSQQKIEAMLPIFSACSPKPATSNGSPCWRIYNLPRSWKELPDIRESRSFLLGWLAGWFAADGTVCERGYSTLSATPRENLEFARSVCSVLGIRTGSIVEKTGSGYPTSSPVRYELSLSGRDLPDCFFILPHHKERAAARAELRDESPRDDRWVVVSVEETNWAEEVFCATVEGVGAFGLAGDLMTGNSPDMHEKVWGLTHKWADVVLFANFETFAKKDRGAMKAKGVGGDDRILYTQRTAAYDAKNRLGLPDHIRLGNTPQSGWASFAEAMKAARARAAQQQQQQPANEVETTTNTTEGEKS
jgi:hypothetical protein